MGDAIERLTRWRDVGDGPISYTAGSGDFAKDVTEALAEIERLRERNAEHEARYDALEAKEEYHKQDAERLRTICRNISSGLRGPYATREDMWKLADSAFCDEQIAERTDG